MLTNEECFKLPFALRRKYWTQTGHGAKPMTRELELAIKLGIGDRIEPKDEIDALKGFAKGMQTFADDGQLLAAMNVDQAIACMLYAKFELALEYLDVAIEQNPNDPIALWNKSMCLLSLGLYREGFDFFESRWTFCNWRWGKMSAEVYRTKSIPLWEKGDIAGKRLLLVHEAGHGDAIMMLRYIPRLKDMGATVTVLALPSVKRLAEQFDVEVITEVPEDLSRFDLRISMFSLMVALGETVETVPSAPYLKAKPRDMGRRIGICWSGESQTSLSLEKFLHHAKFDGAQCQSLQPGPTSWGVQPLPIGDFQDLAEIIMGLEHIVTIDTAAANLAGALGHPSVHVMHRTVMDFRWYRAGAWYPNTKGYRQVVPDDWADPFLQLRRALQMGLPIVSQTSIPGWGQWNIRSQQYMAANDEQAVIALINSVKAKTVIEFGVNEGTTARAVLKNAPSIERYIGIDVEPLYKFEILEQTRERPAQPGRIVLAENDPRFELLIKPRGTLDLSTEDLPEADAIFIDGDHGREAVEHDSRLAADLIRPGGVIIWHDYNNNAVQVTEVLDHLHKENWNIKLVEGTWIAFERFP